MRPAPLLAILAALSLAAPAARAEDTGAGNTLARHLGDFADKLDPGENFGFQVTVRGGWATMTRQGTDNRFLYGGSQYADVPASGLIVGASLFASAAGDRHSYVGLAYKLDDAGNIGAVLIGSDGRAHHFTVTDGLPRLVWIEDSHPRLDGTDKLTLRVTADTATARLNDRAIFSTGFTARKPGMAGFVATGHGISGLTGVTVSY